MSRTSPSNLVFILAWCLAAPIATAGDVVINEIHYEPEDITVAEEFIELHNRGSAEVDVSGWFFSDGIRYTLPAGVTLAAGGFLIVAQDPETLAASFFVENVLGPYDGRLSNDGERIVLRNASGRIEDEVNYGLAFPWPTASAGEGSSMELIHPSLDNDLGGSWRPSGLVEGPARERLYYLSREDENWRYRKGTSEASEPLSAWREVDFVEDATWMTGQTSIGYGDDDDHTILDDMEDNYTGIYLRHKFTIPEDEEIPSLLKLGHFLDDGCVAWINGIEVARINVADGEVPFDQTALRGREAGWQDVFLENPQRFLRAGENVIAVHALNSSIGSGDFSVDVELFAPGAEDFDENFLGFPTPGFQNSVYSENAPPQVRQVRHLPQQPPAGSPFLIRARVTDPEGVASVELRYQIVPPGEYVPAFLPLPHAELLRVRDPDPSRPRNPAFEDPANWTTLRMVDDGSSGDELAGDDTYTVTLPAQDNRTLVRYRLTVADAFGRSTNVPYSDDPSLNFACFVYDGVPGYEITRLTVHPDGMGHVYPREVMTSLAVYMLITRVEDVTHAVAANTALQIPQGTQARFVENWEGAFVYEGVVYDHITYRLRGANGRYQIPSGNPGNVTGKRHWRFKFNKGHHLAGRDRFGNLYPTKWRILNTGRMFGNRLDGNWGLGDQVNDVIWNAYGVPAAFGHAFHFRVIDGPDEAPAGPDGQYLGDFWGIARAFENYDVRFLEAHDLPKGNLYKLVNQTRNAKEQQRYQAPFAVTNGRDHDNIEGGLRPTRPADWLETYVDYDKWYRYHAVVQAIRHYDYWPDANKNAAWYFEPVYTPENEFLGRMWTLPFDADATWGPTWNDGRDRPYDAISNKPESLKAYRSHVREVRDLLWQPDQLELVIRQTAAFMDGLEEPDIDRWRNGPAAAGRQFFAASNQRTLEGKIQDMLRFAFTGGSWPGGGVGAGGRAAFLDSFADSRDRRDFPERPTVDYTGAPGFPIDGLTFRSSEYADPQGVETFRAMEWRLAGVSDIANPGSVPLSDPIWRSEPVKLELEALWRSGALTGFRADVQIPATVVEPGRTYRVRVRMQDDADLWSHWSEPMAFTAGEALSTSPQQDFLRVTEIMYNPLGDAGYEFVELRNIGPQPLDLTAVQLREGIEFSFGESEVTTLDSGDYVVLVNDRAVFETRYDTRDILVAGEYAGRLSNAGELIEVVQGRSQTILRFEYDDGWYAHTDGAGHSLVIRDSLASTDTWGLRESWSPSQRAHGSPGKDEPETGAGLQRPGDLQQDGKLNITDAVALMRHLFSALPISLPCGDGTLDDPANRRLLDLDGDGQVGASDVIYELNYLFRNGPPPAEGTECQEIAGCPTACAP